MSGHGFIHTAVEVDIPPGPHFLNRAARRKLERDERRGIRTDFCRHGYAKKTDGHSEPECPAGCGFVKPGFATVDPDEPSTDGLP